ncbi:MAG: outer membrane lipoprotein carrier protein LolA [Deltaproteobacteria bacterium]|nr:outer membrane lipoprotein carrier protein LolA [Deltaproteobacteria bacterium]
MSIDVRTRRRWLAALLALVALAAAPVQAKPAKTKKKTKTAPAASAPVQQPAPEPAKPAQADPPKPMPAGEPTAQSVADGIFAFYQAQPAVHAAFTQVVTKKGLAAGLKREGLAWIKRGDLAKGQAGKMRWDYPGEEVFYFCNGDILWSYERRERLAVRVPVRNSQVYQATAYLVGQGNLAKEFDLELVNSPLPEAFALKLAPKTGTQLLRSLTLIVDKATFAVRASKLVDPIGDTTELVWRSPNYAAVDDKIFEWQPPAGVVVKDLAKGGK